MRFPARLVKALLRDCRGATAVEYGFILALIFLAICGGIAGLGNQTANMWNDVSAKVSNVN